MDDIKGRHSDESPSHSINFFLRFLAQYGGRIVLEAGPVEIYEDNSGAISVSEGQGSASRLRHMLPEPETPDIHVHRVRDMVTDGTIKVVKVDTKENTADLTTKPAESRPQMVRLWSKVGLMLK